VTDSVSTVRVPRPLDGANRSPLDIPARILFLDIEASGLDERGYPIEIGWVTQDGSGGEVLIRPEPGWTYWSRKAERIHRISRADLDRSGLPARDAARLVVAAVQSHVVYVDAPEWDAHWLGKLLAVAPESQVPTLCAFDAAISHALEPLRRLPQAECATISGELVSEARAYASEIAPRTHRAQADARHAWAIWHRVTELIAGYPEEDPS
jgi:hypothetical protein